MSLGMKLALLLGVLYFCLPLIAGATVKGAVYNESLQGIDSAITTINTTPEQRVVSKDGQYFFDVPNKGSYMLIATYENSVWPLRAEKAISIKDDGDYTIDLILNPDNSSRPANRTNVTIVPPPSSNGSSLWLFILLGLLVGGITGFFVWRYLHNRYSAEKTPVVEKSEQELEREQLLSFIQKHGRVTQKDIRKEFPGFSEAKISLIISELESKNYVQKIKKGRGNIILSK